VVERQPSVPRCSCPACDLPPEDFDAQALLRIMHAYLRLNPSSTMQIKKIPGRFPRIDRIHHEDISGVR
jgi:hypothetical protein